MVSVVLKALLLNADCLAILACLNAFAMRTYLDKMTPPTPAVAGFRQFHGGALAIVALLGLAFAPPLFAGQGADAFAAADYRRALAILEPQAKRGNPEAQFLLGRMRELGLGLAIDIERARYWYQLAAAQGHLPARAALDNLSANAIAPPAATSRTNDAQQLQAMLSGRLPTDRRRAIQLAQAVAKLAKSGDPSLAVLMGEYCESSLGGVPDFAAAARWYQGAARANHPIALNNLGAMFYDGRGVQQSFTEAQRLYLRAAELGDRIAQVNLALMLGTGRGAQVDLPGMVAWLQKSATQHYPRAEELLARCYLDGIGVPVNLAQAAHYFRLSAEQGNPHAQYELGRMMMRGQGIAKDLASGSAWIVKAADAGVEEARLEAAQIKEAGLQPNPPIPAR